MHVQRPASKKQTDVMSQNALNLILLKSAFDNQTLTSIDGSSGTQLGKNELNQMVELPMHAKRKLRQPTTYRLAISVIFAKMVRLFPSRTT